jgi:hypothetical protein
VTRACHTPIRMATGEAFNDAEIDDILDRMRRSYERKRKSAPDLDAKAAMAEAAGEMTREQLTGLLIERRLKVAAEAAKKVRGKRLDAMPERMDEADRLRAFNIGSEKQGMGTSLSADAEGRALATQLLGEVATGLRGIEGAIDRLSNWFGRGDNAFEREVAREMHIATGGQGVEATGNAMAVEVAQVLAGAGAGAGDAEPGRRLDRQAGGLCRAPEPRRLKVAGGFWREIGQLGAAKGDWDAARLAAAKKAFREWRDFITPKLDRRTFAGLDPADLDRLEEARAWRRAG